MGGHRTQYVLEPDTVDGQMIASPIYIMHEEETIGKVDLPTLTNLPDGVFTVGLVDGLPHIRQTSPAVSILLNTVAIPLNQAVPVPFRARIEIVPLSDPTGGRLGFTVNLTTPDASTFTELVISRQHWTSYGSVMSVIPDTDDPIRFTLPAPPAVHAVASKSQHTTSQSSRPRRSAGAGAPHPESPPSDIILRELGLKAIADGEVFSFPAPEDPHDGPAEGTAALEYFTPAGVSTLLTVLHATLPRAVDVDHRLVTITGANLRAILTFIFLASVEDCTDRRIPIEISLSSVETCLDILHANLTDIALAPAWLTFLYGSGPRVVPPIPTHPSTARHFTAPPLGNVVSLFIAAMRRRAPTPALDRLLAVVSRQGRPCDPDATAHAFRDDIPAPEAVERFIRDDGMALSMFTSKVNRRDATRIVLERVNAAQAAVPTRLMLDDRNEDIPALAATPAGRADITAAVFCHAYDLGLFIATGLDYEVPGSMRSVYDRVAPTQPTQPTQPGAGEEEGDVRATIRDYISGRVRSSDTATGPGLAAYIRTRHTIQLSHSTLTSLTIHAAAWSRSASTARVLLYAISLRRAMVGGGKGIEEVIGHLSTELEKIRGGLAAVPTCIVADLAVLLDIAYQLASLHETLDGAGRVGVALTPSLPAGSWLGKLYRSVAQTVTMPDAIVYSLLQAVLSIYVRTSPDPTVPNSQPPLGHLSPAFAKVALKHLSQLTPAKEDYAAQHSLVDWIYRHSHPAVHPAADIPLIAHLLSFLVKIPLKSSTVGPLGTVAVGTMTRVVSPDMDLHRPRDDISGIIAYCVRHPEDRQLASSVFGLGNISEITKGAPIGLILPLTSRDPLCSPPHLNVLTGECCVSSALLATIQPTFLVTVKATPFSRMMKSSSSGILQLYAGTNPALPPTDATRPLLSALNSLHVCSTVPPPCPVVLPPKTTPAGLKAAATWIELCNVDFVLNTADAAVDWAVRRMHDARCNPPDPQAAATLSLTALGMMTNGFVMDRQRGTAHVPLAVLHQAMMASPADPMVLFMMASSLLHTLSELDEDSTNAYPLLSANFKVTPPAAPAPPDKPTNLWDALQWGFYGTLKGAYRSAFITSRLAVKVLPTHSYTALIHMAVILYKIQKLMKTLGHEAILTSHRTGVGLTEHAARVVPAFISHIVFHLGPTSPGCVDHMTACPGLVEHAGALLKAAIVTHQKIQPRGDPLTSALGNSLVSYLMTPAQAYGQATLESLNRIASALVFERSHRETLCAEFGKAPIGDPVRDLPGLLYRVSLTPTPPNLARGYVGPDAAVVCTHLHRFCPHTLLRFGHLVTVLVSILMNVDRRSPIVQQQAHTLADLFIDANITSSPSSEASRAILQAIRVGSGSLVRSHVDELAGPITIIVDGLLTIIAAVVSGDISDLLPAQEMAVHTPSETIDHHRLALAANAAFVVTTILTATGDAECLILGRYLVAITHYFVQTRYDKGSELKTEHKRACTTLLQAVVHGVDSDVELPSFSAEWRSIVRSYHAESVGGHRRVLGFAYDLPRTSALAQAWVAGLAELHDVDTLAQVRDKVAKEKTMLGKLYLDVDRIQAAIDDIQRREEAEAY